MLSGSDDGMLITNTGFLDLRIVWYSEKAMDEVQKFSNSNAKESFRLSADGTFFGEFSEFA